MLPDYIARWIPAGIAVFNPDSPPSSYRDKITLMWAVSPPTQTEQTHAYERLFSVARALVFVHEYERALFAAHVPDANGHSRCKHIQAPLPYWDAGENPINEYEACWWVVGDITHQQQAAIQGGLPRGARVWHIGTGGDESPRWGRATWDNMRSCAPRWGGLIWLLPHPGRPETHPALVTAMRQPARQRVPVLALAGFSLRPDIIARAQLIRTRRGESPDTRPHFDEVDIRAAIEAAQKPLKNRGVWTAASYQAWQQFKSALARLAL